MLMDDKDKDVIGNLQLGQAVVRLQGRSVKPFLLAVSEFVIRKGAMTDIDVISHMTGLGLLSVRKQRVQEPAASSGDPGELPEEPDVETAFLEDVAKYPESGIAERYKRLGFGSVRQGQRVKNWLIERGLVREEMRTTPRGRMRALSATDAGRRVLDSRSSPKGL